MFENITYEYLLKRTLSNVPSDVDKREGSIIYDAIAPCCAELAQMYIQLDIVLNNAFADTAEREYLILRAKERGVVPYEATNAVLKMEVTYSGNDENVKAGDRFSLNNLTYIAAEQSAPGEWKVKCETAGTAGNRQFGDLLPLQTVKDLTTARLTGLLIPGEDLEDTEDFRKRYFDSINSDAFGGNRADYIAKVKAIDGVGQVKAKRTPKGGGTVGIIITDVNGGQASQTVINNVKEKLDPANHTGEGDGIAPIGHSVSVSTVRKEMVDVYFDGIEIEEDADQNEISITVVQILNSYADEINSNWEGVEQIKIYAAQILARCLEIDGIVNIAKVHFDGDNYAVLDEDEIVEFCSNF